VFGEEAYYGVHLVELAPAAHRDGGLVLGRLIAPGHIVLYDQLRSPWRLGDPLSSTHRALLASAGADVSIPGVVVWPGDTLRQFMLGHVLAHELGHHVVQHERRLRGERGVRTREHEARADSIAAGLRSRLAWR
jgi:hypothetical protein